MPGMRRPGRQVRAELQVTEPDVGMSWPDAHRGQVTRLRCGRRLLDDLGEPTLVADEMIGRERRHDRVRVARG